MPKPKLSSRLVHFWEELWFQEYDPLPMAFFRINLGVLLVLFYFCLYPNWGHYYGANGVPSLHDPRVYHAPQWLCLFQLTDGILPIEIWWWIGFLSAIALTAGWRTRWAVLVLFAIETSMLVRDWMVTNGEDQVFRMLLFYGFFAPLARCLSWDGRSGKKESPPAIWPVRLMQINMALLYAFTGADKWAGGADWRNGSALYWVLLESKWTRWPWPALLYGAGGALLCKFMTYGALFAECGFPILVWFRKTRLWMVGTMLLLHIGIAVMLKGVDFFSFSAACGLWAFVPAETIHGFAKKLRHGP